VAEPRVTVNHCATVLGVSWRRTQKALSRLRALYPPDASGTYDARVLDVCRALRGQPHRALEPVESDWLARYLKESHAPQGTQGPEPAHGPGR
jgi:hypothetical protein